MKIVYFAITLVTLTLALPVMADHLPDGLISQSKPEGTIGHVILDKTSAQELIKHYGKPNEIKNYTEDNDTSRGQRTYTWQLDTCKLTAWTWFQPDKESAITTVDVWGSKPTPECTTGRGLYLGASLSELRRTYGRFQQGRNSITHLLYALAEWPNGTQAAIDFDHNNRVIHIQVGIDTE